MARSRVFIRTAAAVVAAAMVLGGCTATHNGDGATDGADLMLYTGAMPAPTPLPAWPLPPAPTPPADVTNQAAMAAYMAELAPYQAAAAEKQAEIIAFYEGVESVAQATKSGGEQSVAAWQSLLVTAGVAVLGADGAPVEVDGNAGFGWAMTDPELRLHAVLAAAPGGLRLVDLAEVLKSIPELSDVDLADMLRTSLSASPDPLFNAVFTGLAANTFYTPRFKAKPMEEIVLSWAQVGLVLRRLSAELAVSAASSAGGNSSVDRSSPAPGEFHISPASYTTGQAAAAGGGGCRLNIDTPWVAELVNQFNKGHATFVFDSAISHIDDHLESKIGRNLGIARVISAFATMIAKMAALKATFSLENAPLVRTKTTQVGELRQLTVTYAFDELSWEGIRGCMNLVFAPFGMEILATQSGAGADIDITLSSEDPARLRVGDGRGGSKPVNQGTTDSNGKSTFTLSGAPQPERIPDQAEPEDVEVTVRAVSNLGGNDFFKDMASLPWDALDAFQSGGISAISTMLSRMQLLTHTGLVPVRDWSLEVEFEAILVGTLAARSANNSQSGGGCAPVRSFSSSTEISADIESERVPVTALLLTNPDASVGGQAVVFVHEDTEFIPRETADGVWMFDLPVNYAATKTHSEPGTGTLPPLHVFPVPEFCAGGGAGPSAPPEPDCGTRNYTGTVEVAVPEPRTLYASDKAIVQDELWLECGQRLPQTAPRADSCDSARLTGGKMPPIEDIFDPSKAVLEVSGSLSCADAGDGWMQSVDYEWTLVLCRLDNEGKSDC